MTWGIDESRRCGDLRGAIVCVMPPTSPAATGERIASRSDVYRDQRDP